MNDTPPTGGFAPFADLGAKLKQIIDLDRASATDIREWTFYGVLELNTRLAKLEELIKHQQKLDEEIMKRQQQLDEEHKRGDKENRNLALIVGGIAWVALIVAVASFRS